MIGHMQVMFGKVSFADRYNLLCIYIYMFVSKNKFESYFSDRLTFQTFTVRFLVEFIDYLSTTARSRNAFVVE